MAIKRAMASCPVLCQTFSFLSLCASESLPLETVVDFVKVHTKGQVAEEMLRTKILKSSFILSSTEGDKADKYLCLHNTVHDVLKKMEIFDPDSTHKAHCIATAIAIFNSQLNVHTPLYGAPWGYLQLFKLASHSKALYNFAISEIPSPINLHKLSPLINPLDVVLWLGLTARACVALSDVSKGKSFSRLAFQYIATLTLTRSFNNEFHVDAICDVEESYSNLELVCRVTWQYNQAEEFHEKALIVNRKIYGEEHGKVATTFYNLGVVCRDTGQYSQAKEFFETALIIRRKIYGEEHGDFAASYDSLGAVCRDTGQYNQAKEFYEKALIIRRKIYGEERGHVAASYNSLGAVCHDTGQYNQAKEFYEKALIIRRKIYGEEHVDVGASYNNLGAVCHDTGQYNQAKEFHEKALIILREIYGEEHGDVATSYN